jgi:hypothetical protein
VGDKTDEYHYKQSNNRPTDEGDAQKEERMNARDV